MAKVLEMPKLSPTMEEGVLVAWHKKEGDAIEVDDLLAEVETDKATMEFRAFDKGTLLKQLVASGTNVRLGQPVAVIGKAGEDISALADGSGAEDEAKAKRPSPAARSTQADASDSDDSEEDSAEGDKDDSKDSGAARSQGDPEQSDSEEDESPQTETAKPGTSPKAVPNPKDAAKKTATSKRDGAEAEEESAAAKGEGDAKADVAKPKKNTATARNVVPSKGKLDRTEHEPPSEGGSGRVLASPYVRKVARERGIDLAGTQGSGEHGRIMPADLEHRPAALERTSQAIAVPALSPPELRPLSPMRKTIARRLTESKQNVPHFYLTIDVDAGALAALRETVNLELAGGKAGKPSDPNTPPPDKISLNDLLIKAVATALVRVPECNAQFTKDALAIHTRVDISVAVAIPDGLVTPVVRNADKKSVVTIAREVRDLAARARTKKLKPEEMSDGTFSISNLGMFGIDEFSAVINPPEGAILAVGQVRDEPVIKDGVIGLGKRMTMTLSCDHRAIDGAVGAAFLAELRVLVEHPMRILTG